LFEAFVAFQVGVGLLEHLVDLSGVEVYVVEEERGGLAVVGLWVGEPGWLGVGERVAEVGKSLGGLVAVGLYGLIGVMVDRASLSRERSFGRVGSRGCTFFFTTWLGRVSNGWCLGWSWWGFI
jgi:hypothetical protein